MKRINPIGSRIGLLMTVVLLIGLGFSLWINRGLAFSPGHLSAKSSPGKLLKGYASHADFEKDCANCHTPLVTSLTTNCLDCHTEVSQEISGASGVHGQIAADNPCATCHPEHKGRTYDPTTASLQLFDHSSASFSLSGHQVNYDATTMECSQCHDDSDFSQVDNQVCTSCHTGHDKGFMDTHETNYGNDCLGCHDGTDRMTNFDHSLTDYALTGKHSQVTCASCHISGRVAETPTACMDCHTDPTIHQGLFEQSCETCHTPDGWQPAQLNGQQFAHSQTTGFSLALHTVDYSNQAITCITCHPNDLQTTDMQTCIDCHSRQDSPFMNDHQAQYGAECLVCHDGVDRLSNFDHDTFFLLDGKHAEALCESCHANQAYRGTPTECSQCHQEPELHAGVFGLKCGYCHTTDTWSPASLRQHDFPINHGLADTGLQLECSACHGANYYEYTCYTCHDHQAEEITRSHKAAGITETELPACVTCHPQGTIDKSLKAP